MMGNICLKFETGEALGLYNGIDIAALSTVPLDGLMKLSTSSLEMLLKHIEVIDFSESLLLHAVVEWATRR